MPAITRPSIPPGAHRDIMDKLYDLHLRAGRPSMRDVHRGIRGEVSMSAVHDVFHLTRVPQWRILSAVVRGLGGDQEEFHALWQAAVLESERKPAISAEQDKFEQANAELIQQRQLAQERYEQRVRKAMAWYAEEMKQIDEEYGEHLSFAEPRNPAIVGSRAQAPESDSDSESASD